MEFSSRPREGDLVDVARYGDITRSENEVIVSWDDPRDLYYVVLRFKERPKDLETLKVMYWAKY